MSEITRRRFFGVTLGGIAAMIAARFLPAQPNPATWAGINRRTVGCDWGCEHSSSVLWATNTGPGRVLTTHTIQSAIDNSRVDMMDLSRWGVSGPLALNLEDVEMELPYL